MDCEQIRRFAPISHCIFAKSLLTHNLKPKSWNNPKVRELQDVVIRFSGDSGDGMQLTGTLFSDTSALLGNGISTFPDYPAEIRAPQGTVRRFGLPGPFRRPPRAESR